MSLVVAFASHVRVYISLINLAYLPHIVVTPGTSALFRDIIHLFRARFAHRHFC